MSGTKAFSFELTCHGVEYPHDPYPPGTGWAVTPWSAVVLEPLLRVGPYLERMTVGDRLEIIHGREPGSYKIVASEIDWRKGVMRLEVVRA